MTFILCPTGKYMFKVNKLVFGNCSSSASCQNEQFRKSYLLLDTYALFNKWNLAYYSHVKILCFPNFTWEKLFLLHKMLWKEVGERERLMPPCPTPFSLALYYEHIMNICFSSKFVLRIPSVLSSFLHAIWSTLSSLFLRHFFAASEQKPI